MDDSKVTELLEAMTHGCLYTCHTIAELMLALATSNASLKSEQTRCAHHQERLSISNEAFAALVHTAINSNNSINQLTKSLVVANTAMSEGEHKLDQMNNTICHLNSNISRLTTDLNDARALGKQDRVRFLEVLDQVCQEKARLQHLNGVMSFTCKKLRQQRNKTDMQLQTVLGEQDSRRSTKSTTATQTEFDPALLLTECPVS